MVLVQKWPFFVPFLGGFIGQKNVFYVTIKRKNAFLGYKKKKFNKSTNWHFSKGVINPWFWSKKGFFSTVFFGAISARKISFKISSKSRKNDIFPKRLTHGFGPKMAIFRTLFFRQYRPGKCLLRYSRTKKRLCTL